MNKQLFVFDVAGTLVDKGSRAPIIAFQKAFSNHGFFPTEEEIKESMGKSKLEHIKDILTYIWSPPLGEDINVWQSLVNDIYESFKKHIIPAVKETNEPIEGVVEALEKLHAVGHAIAFTTGYNEPTAHIALEKLDNQLSFTVPLTTSSDSPGRPTPHMIYHSMLLTNTNDIKDVWKIGDTMSDRESASNAGIPFYRNITFETGNTPNGFGHVKNMKMLLEYFHRDYPIGKFYEPLV